LTEELSLGQRLREMREASGMSIEQLSAETRISGRILKLIEEDAYHDLPAKSIVRGFIVNYCKALGSDGEQLLKEYKSSFEQNAHHRESKGRGHEGYAFEQSEMDQNKRWVLILSSAGLIFVLGALFILKPKLKKRSHAPDAITASDSAVPSGSPEAPTPEQALTNGSAPIKPESARTSSTSADGLTTPTPSNPVSSVMLTATPLSTPAPSPVTTVVEAKASPMPTAMPSPIAAVALPTPEATPVAAAPTPSPTPESDPLRKGDDLQNSQIKIRMAFKATKDTYVKYQSDQRHPMILVLREGKFLVIKAKEAIQVEAQDPSAVKVRLGASGPFVEMPQPAFQLTAKTRRAEPVSESFQGTLKLPSEPPPPSLRKP